MGKKQELPDFQSKRKILFGAKTSPEKMRQAGEQFMQAERYDEALEFLQRCEGDDLTRRIADAAMQAGNTPLFMRAKKVLNEQITESEWLGLAANAEKAGRVSGAYLAYLKAGREEDATRARLLLSGPGDGEQDQAVLEGSPEVG
jgi:hypothetical protein